MRSLPRLGLSSLVLLLVPACTEGGPGSNNSLSGGLTAGSGRDTNGGETATEGGSGPGGPGGDPSGGMDGPDPFGPNCGDGFLTDEEACDDANNEDGDGCSADCKAVTPGYSCRPGQPCRVISRCGDGFVSGAEQCDDGNVLPLDGCSDLCILELGSKCEGVPSVCSPTVCGDMIQEGTETCDDGNVLPFDGCNEQCQLEPQCTAGSGCTSSCGDGLVLGAEACDDGNATSGDGCDASCATEAGFTCTQAEPCELVGDQCAIRVSALYRDFSSTHPDFQHPPVDQVTAADPIFNCMTDGTIEPNPLDPTDLYAAQFKATFGMVGPTLGVDGKPVWAPANCAVEANFNQWYRDVPGINNTVLGSILLFPNGAGGYVNRYGAQGEQFTFRQETQINGVLEQCNPNDMCIPCTANPLAGCRLDRLEIYDGTPLFFPLDAFATPAESAEARVPEQYGYNGWPFEGVALLGLAQNQGPQHNFHFTTEITYWFVYDPTVPATLDFTGDDDVWVYVNGIRAVDLGGIHVPINGSVTIDPTTAPALGNLQAGSAYEVKVFHAERQTEGSSFRLTLSGFNTSRSECRPTCGDGIVTLGEECDDMVNDGGYGECAPGCVLDEFCGDGVLQPDYEDCDDGNFIDNDECAASCRKIVIG